MENKTSTGMKEYSETVKTLSLKEASIYMIEKKFKKETKINNDKSNSNKRSSRD